MQLVSHFEPAIRSGRLSPGDPIPSERDLARALGLGRSSIREGLCALEALGGIAILPSAGAVVAPDASPGLRTALRLQAALQPVPPEDLREISNALLSMRGSNALAAGIHAALSALIQANQPSGADNAA
jgi:GntR family transcriptional repressor for pyruvate dehydrogenase complex